MEEQKNRKETAAGQEKAGEKALKKPAADGSNKAADIMELKIPVMKSRRKPADKEKVSTARRSTDKRSTDKKNTERTSRAGSVKQNKTKAAGSSQRKTLYNEERKPVTRPASDIEGMSEEEREHAKRVEAILQRRRAEKAKQLQRRKMMRLAPLCVLALVALILLGTGIFKLVGNAKPAAPETETTEEVKQGEIEAQEQPVMSSTDIEKMTSSTVISGWQSDETGKWYRNEDGSFYQNGWKEIDGEKYYFDENGYVKTGWMSLDGEDYYFDEEGRYDSTKVPPMVALTFDDGPGKYTQELLDCLAQNDAKATFYMLGQNVEQYPDIVKQMNELGMELSNHTYDHKMLNKLSGSQITDEIEKTSQAIQEASGVLPDTLRPPGGSYNKQVQQLAGMPIVKWSIDTKDWATKSEDQTYQCVMDNVTDGSVVLMHDIHEWSVKAALRMIPELKARGFKLVTVQEMAQAKGITLEDGEVYEYFGEGTQMVE